VPVKRKVLDNKPAEAVDACWIDGQQVISRSRCDEAYPHYALPRLAAGGPLANNIIKCSLKPLKRTDYDDVEFTGEQWQRLQRALPEGVCDYSRPGVGQQPSIPWLTYESGPGGRPLGPAPDARPAPQG
jgi:hypothetical protein